MTLVLGIYKEWAHSFVEETNDTVSEAKKRGEALFISKR